jgi:phosphatidylserine decarboxylase
MEGEGILMTAALVVTGVCGSFMLWAILSVKWKFRMRSALGNAALTAASVLALTAAVSSFFPAMPYVRLAVVEALLIPLVLSAVIGFQFYRDPDRTTPSGKGLVVSPADGTILYVLTLAGRAVPVAQKKGKRFPLTEFIRFNGFGRSELVHIGIEMNVLNVHVNRAPIAGKVIFKQRIKGEFLSLRNSGSQARNERVVHVIEGDRFRVAVVQIASRLVRRIVSTCKIEDRLIAGQRIGMIRFGSQVDLLMPRRRGLRIRIRPGEEVRAGETVLASFENGNR